MAIDALSISAIVIAGLTALSAGIAGIHIKRLNSGCCNCETFSPNNRNSPTNSPVNTTFKLKEIEEIIKQPKSSNV